MSYLGGRTIYIDSDGKEHFDYERDYELKPITNYDRIISKTPEELAKFLAYDLDICLDKITRTSNNCMASCRDCWLDWLKQEATK